MSSNKTKVISIFNNKGGVGKTIITWNFKDALARLGKKVHAYALLLLHQNP
ncbi:MAG: AAA family ATPase [Nostoc sp.]|uniref:ParA family protein n=1 Tax=Nostoc sp. TaxID=1180 RepID=UPI002FF452A5